jgi:hypothetical protein
VLTLFHFGECPVDKKTRRLLCVEDMVITGIVDGVGIDPGGGVSTAGHAAVCSLRYR